MFSDFADVSALPPLAVVDGAVTGEQKHILSHHKLSQFRLVCPANPHFAHLSAPTPSAVMTHDY